MFKSGNLSFFIKTSVLNNTNLFGGFIYSFFHTEWRQKLTGFLHTLGVDMTPQIHGSVSSRAFISGGVYIHRSAIVEPFAYIKGPAYIGSDSIVRQGAYIRGYAYIGSDCVVGHATEVKMSIFCDHAKAGHFAYVGDSILGRNVNLGAGAKLANLKLTESFVCIYDPEKKKRESTGLKKMGSILGDSVQIGCNAVLSPGSLLYPKTFVMPCHHHHGTLVKNSVIA